MPNEGFFVDNNVRTGSLVPAGSAAVSPPVSAAMLLAAADRNTKLQISREALSDQCRALLAYSALENTVMLSALEAHCTNNAPSGAERYKWIADAYAMGAAMRIARWQ